MMDFINSIFCDSHDNLDEIKEIIKRNSEDPEFIDESKKCISNLNGLFLTDILYDKSELDLSNISFSLLNKQ